MEATSVGSIRATQIIDANIHLQQPKHVRNQVGKCDAEPRGAGRNMPTLSKPFCLKRLAEALAEVDAKGQGVARVVSE
jgi:hypothetical protein